MAPTDRADALIRWLLSPTSRALGLPELLAALAERLVADGVPLARLRTSATTMHPELFVRSVLWHAERGTQVLDRRRDLMTTAEFLASPVAKVRAGEARVRCRLRGPEADLSYTVTRELAAEGMSDYVVFPLTFGDGERTFVSFATAAEEGFTDAALSTFEALLPVLAVRVELESMRHTLSSLLRVYLGDNAAHRVLHGAFLRGTGQPIEAAVWFCDMRGFTSLADQRPAAEVVSILDRFFEAVAGPIAPHGGEVLKFIGDAVLAIFPVGAAGPADACARALAAARDAEAGVRALSGRDGLPEIGLGVALHVGEVMYGNIGARERLDFTVIGAVVNEVCRVEALCRTLGPILMTAAFAAHCPDAVEPRGVHALKGVGAAQAIFAPRDALAAAP